MLVTAVYGINALDKLNKIAIPALVIVTVIGCVVAIQRFGTGNLSMTIEDPAMSFAMHLILPDIREQEKIQSFLLLSV